MGTGEFIKKMDHESINYFKSGAEIAEFFRTTFPMSEAEGDKLVGYMEGHGYLLGNRDGKLYRGDLCCEPDEMYWEAYALYDAVVAVGDWNYELLEEAGLEVLGFFDAETGLAPEKTAERIYAAAREQGKRSV